LALDRALSENGAVTRILQHFIEAPRKCTYLPSEQASLEYKVMLEVGSTELEKMLEHGWRRFGPFYFRPACTACTQCLSLRILARDFSPSRTQRKTFNRARRFRCEIGMPRVNQERLDLYRTWHDNRESTREWEPNPLSKDVYAEQFAFPHPAVREVAYYDDSGPKSKLVGLGICDDLPQSWSAIYFFHDPEYARYSLGVFHIMNLIDLAREEGKPYVYLGYRVAECASLKYKGQFVPYETLDGRPSMTKAPRWRRVDAPEE
jgi:leucyl-tRNA---protein transferase